PPCWRDILRSSTSRAASSRICPRVPAQVRGESAPLRGPALPVRTSSVSYASPRLYDFIYHTVISVEAAALFHISGLDLKSAHATRHNRQAGRPRSESQTVSGWGRKSFALGRADSYPARPLLSQRERGSQNANYSARHEGRAASQRVDTQ